MRKIETGARLKDDAFYLQYSAVQARLRAVALRRRAEKLTVQICYQLALALKQVRRLSHPRDLQ